MAKSDWELIEAEYRANQISIRQIAKKHGCSEALVRKKAKLGGWERDLTDKVRARAKAELSKGPATVPLGDDLPGLTEEQIITQAAATTVEVVRSHRDDIARYRTLTRAFGIYLDRQMKSGKLKVMNRKGKLEEVDLPLDYIGKGLTSGTNALRVLVGLERQAFNLDAKEEEGSDKANESLLDLVMSDRDGLMPGSGRGATDDDSTEAH